MGAIVLNVKVPIGLNHLEFKLLGNAYNNSSTGGGLISDGTANFRVSRYQYMLLTQHKSNTHILYTTFVAWEIKPCISIFGKKWLFFFCHKIDL